MKNSSCFKGKMRLFFKAKLECPFLETQIRVSMNCMSLSGRIQLNFCSHRPKESHKSVYLPNVMRGQRMDYKVLNLSYIFSVRIGSR